jgi:TPR repeat protein
VSDESLVQDLESVRRAAQAGDAEAQFALGWEYTKGEHVEADHREAVAWLRRAAQQGHRNATTLLAHKLELGEGVERDLDEALRLYRRAAEEGSSFAQDKCGEIENQLEKHRGVDESRTQISRNVPEEEAALALLDAACAAAPPALDRFEPVGKWIIKGTDERADMTADLKSDGSADLGFPFLGFSVPGSWAFDGTSELAIQGNTFGYPFGMVIHILGPSDSGFHGTEKTRGLPFELRRL